MKKSILALAIAAATAVPAANAEVVIKLGPGVKAADSDLSFQVGGRIQFDYNFTEFDDGTDTVRDESDLHVRRARLYMKGDVGDWSFKTQFNVNEADEEEVTNTDADDVDVSSDNGGTVEDLYIRYTGWGKAAVLTVGKQKEPMGLEELTSSKDISFLERSATTEMYAQGRNVGVQVSGDLSWGHYDFGVFEDGTDKDEASHVATTARIVYNPFKDDDSVYHLGFSVSERAEDVSYQGFEFAMAEGPFHLQAEMMEMEDADGESVDGSYVQFGYIFTGEMRPYKGGKFKKVKPASDAGAWELVVRYTEGFGNYSDVELGKAEEATEYGIGVNWYANNNVRVGATYSFAESDEDGSEEEGNEFRLRTQFTF